MSSPITEFSADQCQALLDYIERLERLRDGGIPARQDESLFRITDEEAAARDSLREAGKFYVPETSNSPEGGQVWAGVSSGMADKSHTHEFAGQPGRQWHCVTCGEPLSGPTAEEEDLT